MNLIHRKLDLNSAMHGYKSNANIGPDHVQVFWKHELIGKRKSIGNQSEAWFPIDLCTYASNGCFQNTCT